jgi:hypothetical protein
MVEIPPIKRLMTWGWWRVNTTWMVPLRPTAWNSATKCMSGGAIHVYTTRDIGRQHALLFQRPYPSCAPTCHSKFVKSLIYRWLFL